MATTSAPDQYPLSTQGEQAIPLEVVSPKALVKWSMTKGVAQTIVIPPGIVAWAYATCDTILRMDAVALPNILVNGTIYDNTMIIPAGSLVTIRITPGPGHIVSLQDGILFINVIVQWGALTQLLQSAIG
jgi:hypothetical protein